MPTKKAKAQARGVNQAKARQNELATMRAKLEKRAQASAAGLEPSVLSQLPKMSVRQRKALKNRIQL